MEAQSDLRGLFAGGGEISLLMETYDWSESPLGHPDSWSASLKTTVGLMLRSGAQIVLFWGPDLAALYNEAYAPSIGNKHPRAFGRPAAESWAELWDDLEPLLRGVQKSGQALTAKDRPFFIQRHGYPETVYFDISYSAVPDTDGTVGGVLCIVSETTHRVLDERRQHFRLKLEKRLRGLMSAREAMDAAVEELGKHLGASRVGYSEVRPDGQIIDCNSCYASGVAPILGTYRLESFGHDSVERQRKGATEIVVDVQQDTSQVQETWAAIDTRAFISVPLVRDGKLLASLYVNYRNTHHWTPDEVALVEEVAARTWAAVEQVKAERALAESEERLRGVFDSDLVGLAIFELEGPRVLAVNDCFLAITGCTREEYESGHWDWRDITPEEELQKDVLAIEQARRRGWWDPYEKEYRLRDGSRQPVRVSSAPFPGKPGQIVVSVQDISATRAAEADLRESEQRLQLAKTAAGLGVWDWNLVTGSISWSPEMYDVLGVDPDTPANALLGAWMSVLHPEDRERAIATAQAAATAGNSFSMDFRVQRKDGGLRWVRSQAVALFDRNGSPERLTGVNVDVTAEHRLEEQLRQKAELLAAEVEERTRERNQLFELSSDLFASAGFDGYLKTINPAWTRLLGYSEAELLATPFIAFVHPDDLHKAEAVVKKLRRGETVRQFEDRLVRKSGEPIWIAWTAVPEGERFYAVGRDVTADREREEHLRQAQKMEAVGQLTGGIAHDFNNVLGAVLSGFELIRRKAGDPDQVRQIAASGAAAAERGAKLTSQLLAFSRAQQIEFGPVKVAGLLKDMKDLLQRTLGPMTSVELLLDEPGETVRSDATQLEMAILNLVINARDAMPEGGKVQISTRLTTIADDPDLPDGHYLAISVSDTGVGMSEDVSSRAFDPFYTTKEIGKGTGLGLSQVYGIAKQAGGIARIRSKPSQGTTVTLLLPCVPDAAEQHDTRLEDRGTGAEETYRILVVDDDEHFRGLLTASLKTLGHDVSAVAEGAGGLAVLEREQVDVLLLDYAMPGLSGAKVAGEVKQRWPDLPIIFLSGYAETSEIEKIASERVQMLRKPFRLEQLQSALARAGRRQAAQPHIGDRPRTGRPGL